MPVTVGRPILRGGLWRPDDAVFVARPPAAGGVECGIAGHLARHEIERGEPRIIDRARPAPLGEFVARCRLGRRNNRPRGVQHEPVAGVDPNVGAAAGKPGIAGIRRDAYRPVAAAGVDVVAARLQQPDPAARDVGRDALAGVEMADVEIDPALPKGDLGDRLVELGDRDLGSAVEVDRVGADTNLGAGLRIGAQRDTGRNRVVERRRRPLRVAWTTVFDLARNQADLPDPGGRRGRRGSGGRRRLCGRNSRRRRQRRRADRDECGGENPAREIQSHGFPCADAAGGKSSKLPAFASNNRLVNSLFT